MNKNVELTNAEIGVLIGLLEYTTEEPQDKEIKEIYKTILEKLNNV